MPPRDSELPEGTDHIINGAMETGAGTGASTGSSATTGGTGGGSSGGFIGGGATGGMGDDTGGTTSGTSGGGFGGTSGSGTAGGGSTSGTTGGATEKLAGQVREQVQGLKGQAVEKVRQFADQGKERATSSLDNFTQLLHDAARSVDERLGPDYGQYAHRAADSLSDLTEGLRGKSVDDLLEDSRGIIRNSPGVAIGAAALIGFALARVVKAGMPATNEQRDVEFTPDASLGTGGTTAIGTTGTSGSTTGTGV